MARKRGRRRYGWFRRKKGSPRRKISVINIVAALVGTLGIFVPCAVEVQARRAAGLGWWSAFQGFGDTLTVLFTGRTLKGVESTSGLKYMGWFALAAAAAIVLLGRAARMFGGRVPIYGRFTLM